MKNRITLSPYNDLVFGLKNIAHLAYGELFFRREPSPIKSAITVTGICLSIAAFIFMVLFSCFLSSNTWVDFFAAILILCALAISGAWIAMHEANDNPKEEGRGYQD